MCEFCENNVFVECKLPEDSGKFSHLDSWQMMLYGNNCLRITNTNGRGLLNNLPIFNVDVMYCPFCGRKLSSKTTLSTYNGMTINDKTFIKASVDRKLDNMSRELTRADFRKLVVRKINKLCEEFKITKKELLESPICVIVSKKSPFDVVHFADKDWDFVEYANINSAMEDCDYEQNEKVMLISEWLDEIGIKFVVPIEECLNEIGITS